MKARIAAVQYKLRHIDDWAGFEAQVRFVLDAAAAVDLGVFSRTDGIKQFSGGNAELKNALFNWGLGAVAWLVTGKVLDKVVRP